MIYWTNVPPPENADGGKVIKVKGEGGTAYVWKFKDGCRESIWWDSRSASTALHMLEKRAAGIEVHAKVKTVTKSIYQSPTAPPTRRQVFRRRVEGLRSRFETYRGMYGRTHISKITEIY
jgi:hypothetical protein